MLQHPVATCRASAATGMTLWHPLVAGLGRAAPSYRQHARIFADV